MNKLLIAFIPLILMGCNCTSYDKARNTEDNTMILIELPLVGANRLKASDTVWALPHDNNFWYLDTSAHAIKVVIQ